MFDALAERFDDMDEIKDVAEYGCSAGVSDFIYSSELCEFFDKYEDEIENMLDDMGYTMHDVMIDREFNTIQQYKEWACWVYLECKAQEISDL